MYVNLGCGARLHPSWENFDISPATPGVRRWDVSRALPLTDDSVAAVYHSHLLEHLRPQAVPDFLGDCFRVLRPGAPIRVVVPDLEGIAREYLAQLDAALRGEPGAESNYDWMLLELYDQVVRERSGGQMAVHLAAADLPNPDFVRARIGEEAEPLLFAGTQPAVSSAAKWRRRGSSALRRPPSEVVAALARAVPDGLVPRGWSVGRFRLSGEAHQWMYDRFSLARALSRAGFVGARVTTATDSLIPGWQEFCLDTDRQGRTRKPDSLFMEAVKPGSPAGPAAPTTSQTTSR